MTSLKCNSHLYSLPPSPHTHLQGCVGNSQAKLQGNYYFIVPTVRGNAGALTNWVFTPSRIFYNLERGLSAVSVPSACPHRVGFIPGL